MPNAPDNRPRAPLNDEIAIALASLVNDAQADKPREPTHSDLDFQFNKAALSGVDPKTQGQTVRGARFCPTHRNRFELPLGCAQE